MTQAALRRNPRPGGEWFDPTPKAFPEDDAPAQDVYGPVVAETLPSLSVIVPLIGDRTDVAEVYQAYRMAIAGIGVPFEFIYLVSGEATQALGALHRLKTSGTVGRLQVVLLGQSLGESAAISSGLAYADGEIIVTLPADPQVDPADIPRVVTALEGYEMAVGRRSPGSSSRPRFHWLLRVLFGHPLNDLMCGVRACRRTVLEEIGGYDVRSHFVPLVAAHRGFHIKEVNVRSSPGERPAATKAGLMDRLSDVLDILGLYVVLNFTKQPLRFFGMIGLPLFAVGFLYTASLAAARVFADVPLAERPALILGVLMIVLGIQVIALGLIGELIIFVSGRKIKDYTIDKII